MSGTKLKLDISEAQSKAGAIKNLREGAQGGGMGEKITLHKMYNSNLKEQSKFPGGGLFIYFILVCQWNEIRTSVSC